MTVIVRPWKLPSQQTMIASLSGMCFFTYPHLRAAFRAVSTPSAPYQSHKVNGRHKLMLTVFIGSIISNPKNFVTVSQYCPSMLL